MESTGPGIERSTRVPRPASEFMPQHARRRTLHRASMHRPVAIGKPRQSDGYGVAWLISIRLTTPNSLRPRTTPRRSPSRTMSRSCLGESDAP